jgi:hypothetical protein
MRRECYDFAQSGHHIYLGISITRTTADYVIRLTEAAGWSSNSSITSFVNPAQHSGFFAPNSSTTVKLSFSQGGILWLFDGGKSLLITSQGSAANLFNQPDNVVIVGEYKKEFGENVNSVTEYLHNGVFTTQDFLLHGNGVGQSFNTTRVPALSPVSPTNTTFIPWGYNSGGFATSNLTNGSQTIVGWHYSQFLLTEAPSIVDSNNNLSRLSGAPVTCGPGFTTRVSCGIYGWVGHLTNTCATSIMSLYTGKPSTRDTGGFNNNISNGQNIMFSIPPGQGDKRTPVLQNIKEYTIDSVTTLKFNVVEPILSCGHTGSFGTAPEYKFSLLGRIFDLKIFGPYDDSKYTFLDSIEIPTDADNFYQPSGGVAKEFWIIPSTHVAFLMPK